jgi:hypothetical protein
MYNPNNNYSNMGSMGYCFPYARLAEAWTPYQTMGMILKPEAGLHHGTIFPELVRPYVPYPTNPKWY